MIKDGCLEEGRLGPCVDSIYGIHLWSIAEFGDILCSEGPVMAASDKFEIDVQGVGGHAGKTIIFFKYCANNSKIL